MRFCERNNNFRLSLAREVTWILNEMCKPWGNNMSTTRLITGREPVQDLAAKRVQTAKSGDSNTVSRASSSQTSGAAPAQVADSVQATAKLMEAAEQEFKRVDEERLEELKSAIKEGRFKVDPDRLAARLVQDAFDDFE